MALFSCHFFCVIIRLGDLMHVVFLDFDGVINTYYWEERNGKWECHLYCEFDFKVNNMQAICWLNQLCKEKNLSIVVISTWRKYHTLENIQNMLWNSGLDEEIPIIGLTPVFGENYSRGKEIRAYLKEHIEIEKIVILDDNCYDMYEFSPYVSCSDTYHGFGIPEKRVAEEILNNQLPYEWKNLEPINDIQFVKEKQK